MKAKLAATSVCLAFSLAISGCASIGRTPAPAAEPVARARPAADRTPPPPPPPAQADRQTADCAAEPQWPRRLSSQGDPCSTMSSGGRRS